MVLGAGIFYDAADDFTAVTRHMHGKFRAAYCIHVSNADSFFSNYATLFTEIDLCVCFKVYIDV